MPFNPKLKDFIEKNPDQTMLGFAWSLWWRLQVIIFAIILSVTFLISLYAE